MKDLVFTAAALAGFVFTGLKLFHMGQRSGQAKAFQNVSLARLEELVAARKAAASN